MNFRSIPDMVSCKTHYDTRMLCDRMRVWVYILDDEMIVAYSTEIEF